MDRHHPRHVLDRREPDRASIGATGRRLGTVQAGPSAARPLSAPGAPGHPVTDAQGVPEVRHRCARVHGVGSFRRARYGAAPERLAALHLVEVQIVERALEASVPPAAKESRHAHALRDDHRVQLTAYRGSPELLDYSATKGAITTFTRSLAKALVEKGIRVNGVAPGPIWTPLIPSTFSAEKVAQFGANTPMKRPGQPNEVAPSFLFLACDDASYMTGAFLHPNGGEPTES